MDRDVLEAVPRFWTCKYDTTTSITDGEFCPICGRTRAQAEAVDRRGTFQVAAVILAHVNEGKHDDKPS